MSTSSADRVQRGARLVGAGIIVSRVAGLVRQRLFSHYFGLGPESDAYTSASKIPNVLRNLLGEGAISASFIPVYSAALARGDEKGARALANALLGLLIGVVAGLTLIGIATCPTGKKLLGGGFVLSGGPAGYVPAIIGSYPTDAMTWRVNMKNTTANFANLSYFIIITCATAQ